MQSAKTPIDKIKLNPNNPRIVKDDKFKKLVQSIKDFPEMLEIRPIVVNDDMVVLGGNMRLKACKEAGLKSVPVIKASNLTPEQQREFIIKDNVGYGEWDWEMLANEWEADELVEWGMDVPVNWGGKDEEAKEDDYEIPDEIKTNIKPGDLIEIGNHRLICGDSTTIEPYQTLFADQMADLVVTDPPYNVDYEGGTGLKIMNDKMDDDKFYQFLYDFYTAMGSFTKAGGAWYVWHADSEGANFRMAMKKAGLMVKQCLIWVKSSLVMGRQDYQWKHEPCLYGWKEGASHSWYSDRKQTTVLEFDKPRKNGEHPTMKPIPLIAYQIGNSSKAGDIVADPFLGSGTTMVASHQMGRRCFGMELDPKYCQVIIDRMNNLDPALTLKINGKEQKK